MSLKVRLRRGIPARDRDASETAPESVLTLRGRGLELVARQLTPADGVEVRRLAVHPLVILILPAVKMDPQ